MDPHEILGVSPTASLAEVEAAYRVLVQIFHPDRFHGSPPAVRKEAERRAQELNEAYRELREGGTRGGRRTRGRSRETKPGLAEVQSAALWLGTAPGSWAQYSRRGGTAPPSEEELRAVRKQAARAATELEVQARVMREMREEAERQAVRAEAVARPKASNGNERKVLNGLGQALHTGEIVCTPCRTVLTLPPGWKERLADTNFYCAVCGRAVLCR